MKLFKSIIFTLITVVCFSNFSNAQATAAVSKAQVTDVKESNAIPKIELAETVDIKVKGVGCAADIKSISDNVEKLEGVSRCKTVKKGATTTFRVTLLASQVEEQAIYSAIEGTPGCKDPNDRPYKVKKSKS